MRHLQELPLPRHLLQEAQAFDGWGIVKGNDPYLYGEKVKAYLRREQKVPGFDEYPNEEVGYGEDVIIRLH